MELRGKRFLVTGGASLVGSHIADQLLAADVAQVVLLDNYSLSSSASVEHLQANNRVRLVRGDILRLNEVIDAAEGIDGVFQVAAFLAQPISQNPWVGLEVNIRGVQNVLEACRLQNVKKVVFSSSVGVYGNAVDVEITEDTPFVSQGLGPVMILYSTSKIMGEQLCRLYRERYGLNFVALRYSSVYGERQHSHSINALYIVKMYESIREGRRPLIPGDGSEVHDYIYVGDVAHANLLAMQSDVSGEAFTIATGRSHSLNDIVRYLFDLCGSNLEPEYAKEPGELRFTVSIQLRYNREKASRLLGWAPQISLEEGLRRFIAWRDAQAHSRISL